MEVTTVPIAKPDDVNVVLGHAHFIKTVEDLYEAIVQTNPAMRFGIAFCEASGPALVRWVGNDEDLVALAQSAARAIGAGHTFVVMLRNGFPVNVLNAIKNVPEVTHVWCATANAVEVVVARTAQGGGVLGVVDGVAPAGVETEADIAQRRQFLRTIGYKL